MRTLSTKSSDAGLEPQDAFDLMHRCQKAGVPAGVVETCEDLFNDAQLSHRNHYVFLDHKEIGRHAYDANCFTLSESPPVYQARASPWRAHRLGLERNPGPPRRPKSKTCTESGVLS